MLNRRILRIKAFEALYSSKILSAAGVATSIEDTQKEFLDSLEAVRDLYIYMLGFVSAFTRAEERRPIHEEKFTGNALAQLLEEDVDFCKILKKKGYSWEQYDLVMRKIMDKLSQKEYYKAYLSSGKSSLSEDCSLFIKIYEEELLEAEGLDEILEGMSLYWNDDLGYALSWCCKTFAALSKGERWSLPPLYQSDIIISQGRSAESDRDFSRKLLEISYARYEQYSDLISSKVPQFDKERLVATDVCIMVCCLVELLSFPTIPVRVSLNEYVEIAKFFGTPKSANFVNGILDALAKEFRAQGLITKI